MSLSRHAPRLLAVGALTVMLAACGGVVTATSDRGAETPVSGDAVVTVEHRSFDPGELTVEAGTEVTWRWDREAGAHDVTADAFASGIQESGTYNRVFAEPGTYAYRCSLHDGMTATITVESA